jgi:hypothetical protein
MTLPPTSVYRFLLFWMIGILTLVGCTSDPAAFTVPSNANGKHILYITDTTLPPGDLAPDIRALFAPTEVQGWGFVENLAPTTRIDTIILDSSIPTERLHAQWLTWAYDRGITIVALNRYTPDLAAAIDDPSIMRDNWVTGDDPYPGDFYIAVSRHIHPNCLPVDATRIVESIETGEPPVAPIIGRCGSGGSRATYSLEEPLGFEAFRHVVNR